MAVRDAVLGWVRALGVYARYGGVPCEFVRVVCDAGLLMGLSWKEMERIYSEGRVAPTPYLMGWVARLLAHDSGAWIDMRASTEELGRFDVTPEYERGWQDSWKAALAIMQMMTK
jgi:hypothetical protein